MKKVILSVATSLDGFIEGPNREIDWIPFTEDGVKALEQFLNEIDTVLYGRISYETWGNYVPAEDSTDFDKNFYAGLNKMKKYVFSTTKKNFEGNPIVVQSNIEETVNKLKQESGKNIWLYGGAELVTGFVNLDLVDEFRIAVFPIILGAGRSLFKNIDHRVKLKLIDVITGPSGIAEFRYEKAV
ncbi:dihydrofolate reductase family protein [Lacibacter sp. H407]|uniref:dihydrofolate reductase family protein n=1 Tax=Lacibacter sp. H407 TaxID=3133423 RepID=UPI0030BD5274